MRPAHALAGPPFDTDDPDPTEYRNYEIYFGATTHRDGPASNSELPFLEVNYGLMPNVQFPGPQGAIVIETWSPPREYFRLLAPLPASKPAWPENGA